MILKKFHITNYKSIKDSGYCELASDITIIAGKNESGKTAIFEALRDFNRDVQKISESAVPLDGRGEPKIELCFEIERKTWDEISKKAGIALERETKEYLSKKGLKLFKNIDGNYQLDRELKKLLNKKIDKEYENRLMTIHISLENILKQDMPSWIEKPKVNLVDINEKNLQNVTNKIINQVNSQLPSIQDNMEKQKAIDLVNQLNELNKKIQNLKKENLAEIFLQESMNHIPKFIFFSDFSDILPFELPLAEAKNHETIRDFAKVANIDLDKVIQTTDSQRRRNLLSDHSALISEDFKDYWKQSKIELIAEPDGDNLRFGILESGRPLLFKVEQRSKGLQWFLSFYLRLNSQKTGNNIILIDEPGLYLHAKAQKDVLEILESISKETQVIFSTHSPYLIDVDKLYRVRLTIIDDESFSRIENKIYKGADIHTLTPIITAIGLDLTQAFSIAGKRNVLLEGISDYYYFQALKEYISESNKKEANLIPCVGAQKIPQLVSLLIGWDLEFLAILDNDQEGKRIGKTLSEKLIVEDKKIIFISKKDNYSVEDLFTHDDFNTYVLEDLKKDTSDLLNSKFLKEKKLDKVLLAKKFFETVKKDKSKITLSEETIKAFKRIFDKISEGFNLHNKI